MEQGQGDDISDAQVTIHSLIKEMENRLGTEDVPPATEVAPDCLISWVNDGTRAVDPGEYQPQTVRIGPFYRDPSHWMEKEKKELLYGILGGQPRPREELERYLTEMVKHEGLARRYYNRTFSRMTSDEFACMLLLDGIFLLSCFVPKYNSGGDRSSDDIAVVRDVVFLIENQIPFFVLEEIHRLHTGEDNVASVVGHVTAFVETLVRRHGYVSRAVTLENPRPCHLLDLLYMYFWPTALGQSRQRSATQTRDPTGAPRSPIVNGGSTNGIAETTIQIPSMPEDMPTTIVPPARFRSATYYYDAGVYLRKLELDGGKVRSILDVELKGGTLHVPCLLIDNNTWRILRNMVALEQYNPRLGSHVTAYCLFMSQIASTEKDVELLFKKGIIVHFLGSDGDVAKGFANLCKGVVLNVDNPDLNYLRPKQEALEELCRSGWRKSMAWLRHSKCNNYLMALAVVAAVIVFLCTLEQSVLNAMSYAKGKS